MAAGRQRAANKEEMAPQKLPMTPDRNRRRRCCRRRGPRVGSAKARGAERGSRGQTGAVDDGKNGSEEYEYRAK